MTLHIRGMDDLRSKVGSELGASQWVTIDQDRVTRFGELTLDQNPLHLDPEAARTAGFTGTIGHGFLSLSMVGGLLGDVFVVDNVSTVLNYGLERVRFPHPLRVGARVRLSVNLRSVQVTENFSDAVWRCTVVEEEARRPVCVADLILRYFRQ